MLISAHLVASSSSSSPPQAGALLGVPAGQLCYPEARGAGASYILRTGQTFFCLLLQTSWGFFGASEELRKRKINAQNSSGKQPLGPESGGGKPSS